MSTTKRLSATPGMNFQYGTQLQRCVPPGCITSSLSQRDSYANMQEFLSIQEIRTFEVVHVNDLMLIHDHLTSYNRGVAIFIQVGFPTEHCNDIWLYCQSWVGIKQSLLCIDIAAILHVWVPALTDVQESRALNVVLHGQNTQSTSTREYYRCTVTFCKVEGCETY